jgi:hypothetical protein
VDSYEIHYHGGTIACNDDKLGDAGRGHRIDGTLKQRLSTHFEQAFGFRIG